MSISLCSVSYDIIISLGGIRRVSFAFFDSMSDKMQGIHTENFQLFW